MTAQSFGPVAGPDGYPLDQIQLAGIETRGYHGVVEHEKAEGQTFRVDVVLHVDTRPAASGDDLTATVDYSEVAERVVGVLGGPSADLIETVAERIAAVALTWEAVHTVDVAVHKPHAPMLLQFDDIVVAIRRDRTRAPVVDAPSVGAQRSGASEAAIPLAVPVLEPLGPGVDTGQQDQARAATAQPARPDGFGAPAVTPVPGFLPTTTAPAAPSVPAPPVPATGVPEIGAPGPVAPHEATEASPDADAEAVPVGTPAPDLEPDPAPAGGPTPAGETRSSRRTQAAAPVPELAPDRLDQAPDDPTEVVLALGSNQGDSQEILRGAVRALAELDGVEVGAVSALAMTKPVGGPADQPDFLNAVVLGTSTLAPRALLHALQQLEADFGRERSVRWGPRSLDIDIVVFDGVLAVTDDLELPHPRAHERAFVLQPWAQVDPDAQLPGLGGGPVAQLAATAPDREGLRWLALDWLDPSGPEA